MVKTKDEVKKIIKKFVGAVSKDYSVTQAILFGSYAHNQARETSDIDLAVVSPDFRGKPEMEILQYLSRQAMKIDTSLEVLAFTPEDLISPDSRSFSYHIKTSGLPIIALKRSC